MTKQPIAFSTTMVSAEKTGAEIEDMLRKAYVNKVGKLYESTRIKGVYFEIDTPSGPMPFNLPVNVDAVYQLLYTKRKAGSRFYGELPGDVLTKLHNQAERTAWRIIHWWLKAQLALIQTQMVTVTEVFLPYMLVAENQTLYQQLSSGGFKALMPAEL